MRKVPEGGGADVGCGMTVAETLEWQGHDEMFGKKSQSLLMFKTLSDSPYPLVLLITVYS